MKSHDVESKEGAKTRPLFVSGSGAVLLGAFALFTCLGLLIQWFVLPVVLPGLHAGHGLQAGGDWIGFHEDGVKLANALAVEGWRAFELRPSGNFPVAISGVLYYWTGIHEPWVVLPIDAGIYALAVVSIFNIFRLLCDRAVALIGLIPIIAFPGSIQFYAQSEKDVWAFAGSAILLFVLLKLAKDSRPSGSRAVTLVVIVFMAAGSGWLVRPYFSSVQLSAFCCAAFVLLSLQLVPIRYPNITYWVCLGTCVAAIGFFALNGPSYFSPSLTANNPSNLFHAPVSGSPPPGCVRQPNSVDDFLPSVVKRALLSVVNVRLGQRVTARYAGSTIDNDVCFSQPSDVLRYLPRALEVGLLAPFPDMWFSPGVSIGSKAMRLIAGAEMTLNYVLLFGILLLAWRSKGRGRYLLLICVFVLPIILLMTTSMINMGTIYRMRYGYLQLLSGLGLIGWIQFLSAWLGFSLHDTNRRSDNWMGRCATSHVDSADDGRHGKA